MSKRPSSNIRLKILSCIQERPLTLAELERKVNTGFRTIKSNCKELELYGFLTIKEMGKHPANGRPSFSVKITLEGMEILKKAKNQR